MTFLSFIWMISIFGWGKCPPKEGKGAPGALNVMEGKHTNVRWSGSCDVTSLSHYYSAATEDGYDMLHAPQLILRKPTFC
jgi:hypothetical protein